MIDKVHTRRVQDGQLIRDTWHASGEVLTETADAEEQSDTPASICLTVGFEDFVMDEDGIAARSELLGLADVIDVIEAEVAVRQASSDEAEPGGENPYTGPYTVLAHREKARCDEARCAITEGKASDPRSPRLRGAMAARRAVTDPVDAETDRDSLIERVRTDSRSRLGARHPKRVCIVGRVSGPTCTDEETSEGEGIFTAEDRALLRAALTERVGEIGKRRESFLHSLTGEDDDPLAEPEAGGADGEIIERQASTTTDPTTLDGLIRRHGGAA